MHTRISELVRENIGITNRCTYAVATYMNCASNHMIQWHFASLALAHVSNHEQNCAQVVCDK